MVVSTMKYIFRNIKTINAKTLKYGMNQYNAVCMYNGDDKNITYEYV